MEAEVLIVGGGPGGAAAAVQLGQRGIKNVVLLDRDPFPRDKTCGSGLSPNALKVIEQLGVAADVKKLGYPINAVRVVTPGGKEMILKSDAAATVLLRRHFDNLLIERAKALGVDVRTPYRATELLKDGSGRAVGVKLFDGQELRAKYVLCADGAHSIFSVDPRPKRTISTLMGWWENFDFAPNSLDMIFDKNVAPLYGWMFPEAKDRVNIGICIDGEDSDGRKQTRPLREIFQKFLDDQYGAQMKKAKPLGKWKGHPISYTTWVGNMTMPGALVLGEAARMTHLATGEGIFQAMQSGIFAADSIADVVDSKATESAAWKSYVWKHRKRFTVGIAGGLLLRAVVDSPVLDGVARLYNNNTVRKGVVRLLGSALAGSNVAETN
jgi:geranylgeranyl reductase family protein